MPRRPLLLLILAGVYGYGDVPREELILARVRAHMSHLLARLPNYTCLQTIERTQRRPGKRMELIDVIRLEVALVDGAEMFAWPGSRKFDDTKINDMVKGGAIGNGNFALHAKAVFQSKSPRFTYAGEETRDAGRRALKWDFVVAQEASGYSLKSGEDEAVVGYHGSFWVDAQSLDVLRLEVQADDIPKSLEISFAADAVDYARVTLGEESFLLPSSSELRLQSIQGYENVNRTRFSGCRHYTGESTISFDDPVSSTPASSEPERTLDLPPGLALHIALDSPINESSAVGDPVTAILKRSVKVGAGLAVPKGAVLHGRITHLRLNQRDRALWVIGLAFSGIEWESTRARLRARLESAPMDPMFRGPSRFWEAANRMALEMGTFLAPGPKLLVRRGLPMEWRTEALTAEDRR